VQNPGAEKLDPEGTTLAEADAAQKDQTNSQLQPTIFPTTEKGTEDDRITK
jgi:hypothetical protein